jgi:hypothetical protein
VKEAAARQAKNASRADRAETELLASCMQKPCDTE